MLKYIHHRWSKQIVLIVFILTVIFVFPANAQQAPMVVYFTISSSDIVVEDIFVVEVRISSVNKKINATEATLFFDNDMLQVQEISTGGSLFHIWPKKPIFSNDLGEISFAGGVLGGFLGEDAEIFKIIFLAKGKGDALLDFRDDITLFLHDGKGTEVAPWVRPLHITIAAHGKDALPKQQWKDFLSNDITSPNPFDIILGKNKALFNGKYFISFFAYDAHSGIDHYEVREGNGNFFAAESPYVLKDQGIDSIIEVKAVDKAGNERIVLFKPDISIALKVFLIVLMGFILLFVIFVLHSKFLKKR